MSKIVNGGLTQSGTGCFTADYPYGNSGRQRVTEFGLADVSSQKVYIPMSQKCSLNNEM